MTFVPSFASPCDFATQTPAMVAEFLDFKSKLVRERGEPSVTDLLISCILKLSFADISVIVPYEPETGADFDILLLNATRSAAIQYRMQAKKLTHNGVKDWQHRSYRELDHPHGTGEQAKTLIRSSAHEKVETIPLYIFYNDADTCSHSNGDIEGISLADGVVVSRLVRQLVAAKPKRLPFKRIGNLSSLFFPFSTLLCTSEASGSGSLISPDASRRSVQKALGITRDRWRESEGQVDGLVGWLDQPEFIAERRSLPKAQGKLAGTDDDKVLASSSDGEVLEVPDLGTSRDPRGALLPLAIERALERRGPDGIVRAPVKRTKVVLQPK